MCVRPSYIHNRPRLVILPLCRRQARCIRQHLRGDRMTITKTGNPRDSRPIHWLFAGAMALLMSGCGDGGTAVSDPGEFEPPARSEEHTSELQSRENVVCRLLLEKKKPV